MSTKQITPEEAKAALSRCDSTIHEAVALFDLMLRAVSTAGTAGDGPMDGARLTGLYSLVHGTSGKLTTLLEALIFEGGQGNVERGGGR